MPRALFFEGPAGTGKTGHAIQHIRDLLDRGVSPESILVLVPQRTLGQPYETAFAAPDWPSGAQIDVVTLGGLARRGLDMYWPLVAEKAGFVHPDWEPHFLTIETSQYHIAQFVNTAVKSGVFDSVSITPFRIMRQTLDNLSKAAVNRFALDEVAERLSAAWGDRHSSRPPVYHASMDIAQRFRAHCLENSLLDFSLQTEVFIECLLAEPLYRERFTGRYHHLVVDNLEENYPVVADFIRWVWDALESALLVYDTDAGYRVFLGADPAGMRELADLCGEVQHWDTPVGTPPVMVALANELSAWFAPAHQLPENSPANPREGFVYESCRFYPQMIDWVVANVINLVGTGVPPREIVVLAPFLGDSLRFSLMTRLDAADIPTVSHRPSRAVRDEPAARAILTLMALAYPEWGHFPPVTDVVDALHQTINGLDPVRAWLLAQIVYRPGRGELGAFETIRHDVQTRITFDAGGRYEQLRDWLLGYRSEAGTIPPDHFLSRLFGEVLSQPGFGFHTQLDAGRVIAELIESARKFRQMYPSDTENWLDVSHEYFSLVQEGLLAALYVSSWRDEQKDAVFLAPAHTFLMRNRWADYQFWLDVGSNHWWERLEQPLTHPYVLTRGYPAGQVWTDELEFQARRAALSRLLAGLVRRCRKNIYIAISNLGEQGYEQRGPLLQAFQSIVQRHDQPEEARS